MLTAHLGVPADRTYIQVGREARREGAGYWVEGTRAGHSRGAPLGDSPQGTAQCLAGEVSPGILLWVPGLRTDMGRWGLAALQPTAGRCYGLRAEPGARVALRRTAALLGFVGRVGLLLGHGQTRGTSKTICTWSHGKLHGLLLVADLAQRAAQRAQRMNRACNFPALLLLQFCDVGRSDFGWNGSTF